MTPAAAKLIRAYIEAIQGNLIIRAIRYHIEQDDEGEDYVLFRTIVEGFSAQPPVSDAIDELLEVQQQLRSESPVFFGHNFLMRETDPDAYVLDDAWPRVEAPYFLRFLQTLPKA